MRKTFWLAGIGVVLAVSALQPAFSADLAKVLEKAKIAKPGSVLQAEVNDDVAEITLLSASKESTKEEAIAAVRAGKAVLDAYPQVSATMVKFSPAANSPEGIAFFMNSKDAVGLGAGTTTVEQLASTMKSIQVNAGDPPGQFSSKCASLAEASFEKGNFLEAQPLLMVGASVAQRNGEISQESRIAEDMERLASYYRSEMRMEQAVAVLRKVIALKTAAARAETPEVAKSMMDLADLYQDDEDYANAAPLIERALAIKQACNEQDADYASDLERLALCEEKQNHFDKAEDLLKQTISVKEKAVGANSPSLAMCLERLGDCYLAQKNYTEALPLYKRAKSICDQAVAHLGKDKTVWMDYNSYNYTMKRLQPKLSQAGGTETTIRKTGQSFFQWHMPPVGGK